jgi:hypothetical protein
MTSIILLGDAILVYSIYGNLILIVMTSKRVSLCTYRARTVPALLQDRHFTGMTFNNKEALCPNSK